MDKRTSMGVIGDVGRYTQFQAADAMRDAAQIHPAVARNRRWVGSWIRDWKRNGWRDVQRNEPRRQLKLLRLQK